jgi:CDP-glycerol glycerophosphotransferase
MKNKKTKISIIVPVFNTGEILNSCLDSLVNQNFDSYEILICDDFSTDKVTLEIINKFSSIYPNLITILRPKEKGANFARQAGLNFATSEFVTFVDSDDKLIPNALKLLYETIIQSGSDLVIGKMNRITQDGKLLYDNITLLPPQKEIILDNKIAINFLHYLKPTLCGKLYKRILFQNIPIENPPFYQDWNITYKILPKLKKILFIDEAIYHYTYNNYSNASNSNPENKTKILDSLICINGIIKYYRENSNELIERVKPYIVFDFLTSFIGRSIYIDSMKYRRIIHCKSKHLWHSNFNFSYFKLNKSVSRKLILRYWILFELYRIAFILRIKIFRGYQKI